MLRFNDKIKREILANFHGRFFKVNNIEFINYTAYKYWLLTESDQYKFTLQEIKKYPMQEAIINFISNEGK